MTKYISNMKASKTNEKWTFKKIYIVTETDVVDMNTSEK